MKNHARIITGTALALLMTAGHAVSASIPTSSPASPHALADGTSTSQHAGPIILAQADNTEDEEELRRRRDAEQESAPAPEQRPAEEPAQQEPPAEQPAPPPAEEPAPEPQPEQAAPPHPEAPAEPQRRPDPEPEPSPAPAEEPAAPETAPVPEEAPAEPTPEQAPVPEEVPSEPTPEQAPTPQEAPPAREAPAEQPAPAPEDAPAPENAPTPSPAPEATPVPEPAPEQRPVPRDTLEEAPAAPPVEQPDTPRQQEQQPPVESQQRPDQPTNEAPLFDSQKEPEQQPTGESARQPEAPAEPAAPPPATDAEAQQLETPVEVQSLRAEEGRRIERREERMERREGANVLREFGDRVILQFNNQTIVQSDDRDRIGRDASEVYYEELPRGRSRETVVRPNGVQVVTIRDRYGDIVQRSRITPDGREYVLVYADERDWGRDDRRQWRDPGLDLPPLRVDIPRDEYILDARRAQEPEDYYEFFEQPPVEPVRRLYTIDEVKYSARVRDSVRRVDMDTITFDFGSASISESEVARLEGVAIAMERLLEQNPAETFLIEGHTDAVGSDQANLALSDQRAESVAAALTNVFAIPPENLVTQGYGERYLKVNTEAQERANRRVAMRRITPLVAPVAEAQ